MDRSRTLIIGVDGGGTQTVAMAMGGDGRIRALARGQGINYNNIGLAKAQAHLRDLVDRLLKTCGATDYSLLCVGMSALDGPASPDQIRFFADGAFDEGRLLMDSDAHIALYTAVMDGSGLIVVCGTGSMAVLRGEDGTEEVRGGWGWLLGDPLSAFGLAVDGLRAATAWWEEKRGSRALAEELSGFFDIQKPRQLINALYDPPMEPQEIASLAPAVLRLGRQGDEAAGAIIARHISRMADAIASFGLSRIPDTIWVYGGVFAHNPEVVAGLQAALLQRGLTARLSLLHHSPAFGALGMGLKRLGLLDAGALQNMQDSYQEVWA